MLRGNRKSNENLFEECDSVYVCGQVGERLLSSESRSLWRRIESEMNSGGVGAVDTYLRSSFDEIVQQLKNSMIRFKESFGGEK